MGPMLAWVSGGPQDRGLQGRGGRGVCCLSGAQNLAASGGVWGCPLGVAGCCWRPERGGSSAATQPAGRRMPSSRKGAHPASSGEIGEPHLVQ